jgi:uncharacterized protein involved in exopolysaccharide biosynthesis
MGLIILITLIGCVISVLIALTRIPVYNAIAVVQIEDAQVSSPSSVPGSAPDPRSGLDARRTVNLIEQRVMSRDSLLAIMDKYDLFTEFPNITLAQRLAMMRESVSISPILSGEAWQPNQSVSGMIIDVNLSEPQTAADVANDLLARVMEEARSRSVDRAQVELEFFAMEEERIREDIVEAEAAIAEFKSANAEVLPSNVSILQSELTTLNGSLLTLRQEILSLESNSSRVRPEALERQVSLIEDQIGLVQNRIAELNALLTRAPAVERELASLERELTQLNEQFTVISRRKADAEMSQSLEEQRQLARFEVLEPAIAPVYAVSRSKRSIAILGGIASGLLAVGVAFLLEMLNPPIRNAAQMERVLGVRPVISVPVIETGAPAPTKKKSKKSKFGWGVVLALLLGLIGLVVKPIVDWLGYSLTPRSAQ